MESMEDLDEQSVIYAPTGFFDTDVEPLPNKIYRDYTPLHSTNNVTTYLLQEEDEDPEYLLYTPYRHKSSCFITFYNKLVLLWYAIRDIIKL